MSYCWSHSGGIAMVWGIAWWIPPRKEKMKAACSPFQVRASQAQYPGTSIRLPMLATFSKSNTKCTLNTGEKAPTSICWGQAPAVASIHERLMMQEGVQIPACYLWALEKDLRAGKCTISVHSLLLMLLSLHCRNTHHKQRKQAGKAVVSLARSAIY